METRERILKTTRQLLEDVQNSEHPEKLTRMSDIAKSVGISRQALYLHFPSRTELLIATVQYADHENRVEERFAASRAAGPGAERLELFIDAWGGYIPEIYGVASALMAMPVNDEAARAAGDNRMAAVRHGCVAAIKALADAQLLTPTMTESQATDYLWTLLSIDNWVSLTRKCDWDQQQYLSIIKDTAKAVLVRRD